MQILIYRDVSFIYRRVVWGLACVLGHARVLTTHRVVIHYAHDTLWHRPLQCNREDRKYDIIYSCAPISRLYVILSETKCWERNEVEQLTPSAFVRAGIYINELL